MGRVGGELHLDGRWRGRVVGGSFRGGGGVVFINIFFVFSFRGDILQDCWDVLAVLEVAGLIRGWTVCCEAASDRLEVGGCVEDLQGENHNFVTYKTI